MTLLWQWFCKIPFPDSTYLKWKVLITGSVTLETNEDRFEYFVSWVCYLSNWLMTLILQNTISRFNLFRIESFDSWVLPWIAMKKKMCWMSQQGTEKSISDLSFELALALGQQWFCKTLLPDSAYFELKVLIVECATL